MADEDNGAVDTGAPEDTTPPTIEQDAARVYDEIEAREKAAKATPAAEAPQKPASDKPAAAAPRDAKPADKAPAAPGKPLHGPDGKFISASATPEGEAPDDPATAPDPSEPTPEPPAITEPGEPAPPAIAPPASLSALAKAEWPKLPPAVQADLVKRESEVQQGFQQRAQQLARYQPIEEILAPRRQQLAMQGMTEAQALTQLFALSDFAARDPHGFLDYFARGRGIDLAQFAQQRAEAQAGQPQPDPHIAPLMQEVTQLKQFLNQQQAQQRQAEQSKIQSEIDQFRDTKSPTGAPAHPHFEAVRPMMAALMEGGQAPDLQTAYDMAVYASPATRAQLEQEQRAKAESDRKAVEAKRLADEKAKAEAARKAAGTQLRPAGSLPGRTAPKRSLEETAREAYDRING